MCANLIKKHHEYFATSSKWFIRSEDLYKSSNVSMDSDDSIFRVKWQWVYMRVTYSCEKNAFRIKLKNHQVRTCTHSKQRTSNIKSCYSRYEGCRTMRRCSIKIKFILPWNPCGNDILGTKCVSLFCTAFVVVHWKRPLQLPNFNWNHSTSRNVSKPLKYELCNIKFNKNPSAPCDMLHAHRSTIWS
jgi:hypothetical protein